jgi:hypothetical protein
MSRLAWSCTADKALVGKDSIPSAWLQLRADGLASPAWGVEAAEN